MGSLTIYQDDYEDKTFVSNLFIDEYMKDADGVQIKVFLYLVRMMSSHKATSISDIAGKFNYSETEINNALDYWEKKMLLSVTYDDKRNPVGVFLKTIPPLNKTESPAKPAGNKITQLPAPLAVKEPITFTKPSYSLDELKAFKEAEETSQLLFVVEQYLNKTLSSSDIKSILFFLDTLNFSGELVDYLIQYCVERGKKDFRYIEKVAISWAEEGILTPKQAAKAARKYEKIVYDVMKALGKQANPTRAEADYIMRWTREFGFNADIIYEACERTVMAVDNHRFEYCNKILTNWKNLGVHNKADILETDSAFVRKHKATGQTKASAEKTLFNQFKQNHYDFESLEREIISN